MVSFPSRRVLVIALSGLLAAVPARAQTGTDTTAANAGALYQKGDYAGALSGYDKILAKSPTDGQALYLSAFALFEMGRLDEARNRAEKLVSTVGSYVIAWELLTQIVQNQGDLHRRDEAIAQLKGAIDTAIDPTVRAKGMFLRDRFRLKAGDLVTAFYFTRAGTDFARYEISWVDPAKNGYATIYVRTDAGTTEQWNETALLPPDALLFHLDMVDIAPDGSQKTAIYQYFVGEPDYDTVRARVLDILRGKVKPLSGTPGSLDGIMKP